MSSNAESESGEEEQSNSGSNSPKHDKPPGFSFSKSAIADLPSTAVQSIHIENEEPVEMDDDAFVWKDVTPSGTKLAGKAKFKKQDWAKGKQQAATAAKHAPVKVPTAAAVKANPAPHHQTAVKQTAVPAGHHTAAAAPPTAVTANSLARMESKNRAAQMVKERPSQGKGATTAAAVPKRAPSGPKLAAGESATRLQQQQQGKQTGSQTKVGGGKNARREQPHHGKQAQHK